MEILLKNSITGQVIREELLSKKTLERASNVFNAEFALEVAAVAEWMDTLDLDSRDAVLKLLHLKEG